MTVGILHGRDERFHAFQYGIHTSLATETVFLQNYEFAREIL